MRVEYPYHSALWDESAAEPCERVELRGGLAFRHDIYLGLPEEFARCDVLYSEPPWPAGVEVFDRRAGVAGGDYRRLMEAIGAVITGTNIPTFLITGDRGRKLLPMALQEHRIILNGAAAWCMVYRKRLHDWPESTEALLERLAAEFGCVGDFCCGYGTAGRVFRAAGKRFVLADYNARCIGHIAAHLGGS